MNKRINPTIGFLILTLFITLLALLCITIKEAFAYTDTKEVCMKPMLTVIIDAGHGGEDGGAVGGGNVFEKDLNLSIALKIGKQLENSGINTIYSRTEDILLYDRSTDYTNRKKMLDLAARVELANKTENCIFVSIHMNSFPQKQYKGLQVYYSKNNKSSKEIALAIQNAVKSEIQPQNNRKIVEATNRIYLLDRIQCPAILIECGFLSNPEECRLLTTEIYQNQLSKIISEEIKKYIEKNSQTY